MSRPLHVIQWESGICSPLKAAFDPGILRPSHPADRAALRGTAPSHDGWAGNRRASESCRVTAYRTRRSAQGRGRRSDRSLSSLNCKRWPFGKDACADESDEAADPGTSVCRSVLRAQSTGCYPHRLRSSERREGMKPREIRGSDVINKMQRAFSFFLFFFFLNKKSTL